MKMWIITYIPAHDRLGAVLFLYLWLNNRPWRGESSTEWHIQRPAHASWRWFGADPVEESDTFLLVEVLSEATESELTRLFFLRGPPTVTVRLRSKHRRQENESSTLKWQLADHYTAICLTSTSIALLWSSYLSNHWVWNVRSTSGFSTVSSHFPSSDSGTKKQKALGQSRRDCGHTHLSFCHLKCCHTPTWWSHISVFLFLLALRFIP